MLRYPTEDWLTVFAGLECVGQLGSEEDLGFGSRAKLDGTSSILNHAWPLLQRITSA